MAAQKKKTDTVEVVLHHISHAKGAEGRPGDTVKAPKELAERWLKTGAASIPNQQQSAPSNPQPQAAATNEAVVEGPA